MTILGTDAASRLPRLARRALAAAEAVQLPEAMEYAGRWLTLASELTPEELVAGEGSDDALRILAVLVQLDRYREARALSELARRALPVGPARTSFELFEDATDIFNGVRPWHEVPSARQAFATPIETGSDLDVVHAAVRSTWASLDDDDPERALTHSRAGIRAVAQPASWPILIVAHVLALVASGRVAELAHLRSDVLDTAQWSSRVRTHPAFLSARVVIAEMTMRTWLAEEITVVPDGSPPESRDRARVVVAALTDEPDAGGPIDLEPLLTQTLRARHGSLLGEAMRRARHGDATGALIVLEQAYSEPGSWTMFPVAVAVAPWRFAEPLLTIASMLPEDDPARRVLAVTDYPIHRDRRR